MLFALRPMLKKTFLYQTLYLNYFEKILRPDTAANSEIFLQCMDTLTHSVTIRNSGLEIRNLKNRSGAELPQFATFTADVKISDNLLNSM